MTRKRVAKGTPRTPAAPPPIPSARPPTPTELWYLECLRILTAHYKRPPKITELARYCDRSLFPTWSAMLSLEAKGVVARVECDDGRRRFVEVTR